MIAFIDDHRGDYGVEPICRVLPIAPSTYYDHLTKRADPDLAREGGSDFYATVLEYGDGSRQACSYVTQRAEGFSENDLSLIDKTRVGLASAMEPVAKRRSLQSLLKTYVGSGPSSSVVEGTIRRGDHTLIEAAILFAELRGFTAKSEAWTEDVLLKALDDYFEAAVEAVHSHGGDVLKFLGDGILAVFPVGETKSDRCDNAVAAARTAVSELNLKNECRIREGLEPIEAGFGISFGSVTYGNIGSPDRHDFTVVGSAVNLASRIQDLCKSLGKTILVSREVADELPDSLVSVGRHELRGISEGRFLFSADAT